MGAAAQGALRRPPQGPLTHLGFGCVGSALRILAGPRRALSHLSVYLWPENGFTAGWSQLTRPPISWDQGVPSKAHGHAVDTRAEIWIVGEGGGRTACDRARSGWTQLLGFLGQRITRCVPFLPFPTQPSAAGRRLLLVRPKAFTALLSYGYPGPC